MPDKVLDKMEEIISTEKFDLTEILIDTGGKLPDDFAIKNVAILITCVIKDGGKYYPKIYLVALTDFTSFLLQVGNKYGDVIDTVLAFS